MTLILGLSGNDSSLMLFSVPHAYGTKIALMMLVDYLLLQLDKVNVSLLISLYLQATHDHDIGRITIRILNLT